MRRQNARNVPAVQTVGVSQAGTARAVPAPSRVGNAVPHVVVDYAVDRPGYTQAQDVSAEIGRRLAGGGGAAWVGSGAGGEGGMFYGCGPGNLQAFAGAAALASNPITYREGLATIETGIADGPYADPARRIFAERLARRR